MMKMDRMARRDVGWTGPWSGIQQLPQEKRVRAQVQFQFPERVPPRWNENQPRLAAYHAFVIGALVKIVWNRA